MATEPQDTPAARASDQAELSSISSNVTELKDRVTEVAERWHKIERMDIAGDLFEVERALRTAERRLSRVARTLR